MAKIFTNGTSIIVLEHVAFVHKSYQEPACFDNRTQGEQYMLLFRTVQGKENVFFYGSDQKKRDADFEAVLKALEEL